MYTLLPKRVDDAYNSCHSLKLYKANLRKQVIRNTFSIRTVNTWNQLPETVVTSYTAHPFKSKHNKSCKSIASQMSWCFSHVLRDLTIVNKNVKLAIWSTPRNQTIRYINLKDRNHICTIKSGNTWTQVLRSEYFVWTQTVQISLQIPYELLVHELKYIWNLWLGCTFLLYTNSVGCYILSSRYCFLLPVIGFLSIITITSCSLQNFGITFCMFYIDITIFDMKINMFYFHTVHIAENEQNVWVFIHCYIMQASLDANWSLGSPWPR